MATFFIIKLPNIFFYQIKIVDFYREEKMKKIIINGKFLCQKMTGVQRVAYELIKQLDNDIERIKELKVILYIPRKEILLYDMELKNIKIERGGIFKSKLWEFFDFGFFVIKERAMGLVMTGMAPFYIKHMVFVHDISFKKNKKFYSKKYTFFYDFITYLYSIFSKKIITVSNFSKKEIEYFYPRSRGKIEVIYNGGDHILRIKEDYEILKKLNLEYKGYFFSLGSVSPNKNMKYIVSCASNNSEKIFVITGKPLEKSIFGKVDFKEIPKNIIFTGYLKDEEIKTLYKNCEGFIFPSIYEGFGLPPLEAMFCGAECYISNKSCLPEIFLESVNYINLNDNDFLKNKINKNGEQENYILNKYTWSKASKQLIELLIKELK